MAKLKYTFQDYMNNPSGKGSAVNSIGKDTEAFEKELLSLESRNGPSKYTVYRNSKSGGKIVYYIHFQIPSSTKDFFNDVVVEFNQDSADGSGVRHIKNYTVKFFSNDSNFIYTYAYTFKTHGLLISELEGHLPFRCLIQKPVMRNPDNAMGYNKSICFAYIIMVKHDLFNKDTLSRIAKSFGINKLSSEIPKFDKKNQERNKLEKDIKTDKNKDKEQQSPPQKIIKSKNLLGDTGNLIKSKFTKTTGIAKKVSTIKKVKRK